MVWKVWQCCAAKDVWTGMDVVSCEFRRFLILDRTISGRRSATWQQRSCYYAGGVAGLCFAVIITQLMTPTSPCCGGIKR